ncbi:DNA polymerase III subunit gamma/tau [Aquiflexum sp. TKW24L]|uniref:DNA polymerase III subunit gamma/tau n=1 Tax=Aquiflexum sp. TKW24L TaxID=2942212 RepID=UPI0020BF708A|nr:DNA polymerase III subunit gamma/tau [Aquiflexum sp. TKW24L]MCL6257822.1 DNA polymerase III subunit gamma/tau [Aquiflexum sp. TKW24L]
MIEVTEETKSSSSTPLFKDSNSFAAKKTLVQKTLSIPTSISSAKIAVDQNSAAAIVEVERKTGKLTKPSEQLAEIFDLAKLKAEINEIIDEYKEHHRSLEVTVLKQPVVLLGETITFQLNGEIQEGIFNKIKPEILQVLRRKLNNYSIHLDAVIKEEDENNGKRKLYTSTDKLNYLLDKSPALGDLKRRFGLETDF